MSIEDRFDIPFLASLAFKEKQIQQNYRPIIAVHKWFARRPGTLFRGLLLSEFAGVPLREAFYSAHNFAGKRIADPFMGGGTPLLEANRLGFDVTGCDVNAMSSWIVREEIEPINLEEYRSEAQRLLNRLGESVGRLYRTSCPRYGDKDVPVKYFLWVKTVPCQGCQKRIDLFPGYLVADTTRHSHYVIVCKSCGELNQTTSLAEPGRCASCSSVLVVRGPAQRNRCRCPNCDREVPFPQGNGTPLSHRMFAIEYFNPNRPNHKGRFFKTPDTADLAHFSEAERQSADTPPSFVPPDAIPRGDETDRLHRWGYTRYHELFNSRQLLGLELSCRAISNTSNQRIRRALATNLSDLLRYQNMLCRYDTSALKSLDIFSVHGFPVGLIQCESNILGILKSERITVGSGGWVNIIEKYAKAKAYAEAPFEVRHVRGRKEELRIKGEWIGSTRRGQRARHVALTCQNSADLKLSRGSLDAVITDPPYFGNIQYAELMDFCYVWLRRVSGGLPEELREPSTRSVDELTVNVTAGRGLSHFTEGLSKVFTKMAHALKPGAPLVFTYHHNKLEAYLSVGVAILDAGLICSATLPCPAEMGGSIHIHGTGSSIVDSIFVCRSSGKLRRKSLFETSEELGAILTTEIAQLRSASVPVSQGDIRCMLFGHLTRISVWNLRRKWNKCAPVEEKLAMFKRNSRSSAT